MPIQVVDDKIFLIINISFALLNSLLAPPSNSRSENRYNG